MSENGKSEKPKKAEPARLIIDYDLRTGAVSINGPVGDPVLCYGMLEAARFAVHQHNANAALREAMRRPSIVPAGALANLPPIGRG